MALPCSSSDPSFLLIRNSKQWEMDILSLAKDVNIRTWMERSSRTLPTLPLMNYWQLLGSEKSVNYFTCLHTEESTRISSKLWSCRLPWLNSKHKEVTLRKGLEGRREVRLIKMGRTWEKIGKGNHNTLYACLQFSKNTQLIKKKRYYLKSCNLKVKTRIEGNNKKIDTKNI